MSIITRCPECRASFKVVPDQIKISEGWARCGRCQSVFDALANEVFTPSAPSPAPAAPVAPSPAAGSSSLARHLGQEKEPELRDFSSSVFLPQDVGNSAGAGKGDIFRTRHSVMEPEDDFADSLLLASQSRFLEEDEESLAPSGHGSDQRVMHPGFAASGDDLEDLSAVDEGRAPNFVRRAEKAARWQQPWVRVLLWLLLLLLLLALAGQWAWRSRDYLAVAYPQLRPSLEQACGIMACKISAWHDVDALKVESSGFSKVREQQFRLNIHLRNAAKWPVATPAVFLSLKNSDGQVLVKRVFLPAELGLPSSTLAAREEYIGNALLDVADNELSNAIADYEMNLFYP